MYNVRRFNIQDCISESKTSAMTPTYMYVIITSKYLFRETSVYYFKIQERLVLLVYDIERRNKTAVNPEFCDDPTLSLQPQFAFIIQVSHSNE